MGMNAAADDSFFQNEGDARGLIGVEVGFMGTNFQKDSGKTDINDNPIIEDTTTSSASIGLKFGAESRHYRAFVEGRIWNTDEYNNGATVGGALQYLIPTGDKLNLFIGINGGAINVYESDWDPYLGADLGVNIDMNNDFGIEIGGRYSSVDVGSSDMNKATSFYGAYVTAIFKFSGDY